ncbi:MAG: ISL3 family transposase [Anaerolineae bacterium]|nr:ISL3 family transposase [Anaerolineae bacterium]
MLGAKCPCCGCVSRRVHSHYVRHLDDAPLRQVQVSIELHVRKFYCDKLSCERSIFVERVAGLAASYARRTIQPDEMLRLIAFANGGECGSRVAAEMRMPINPQTLIRLIRRQGAGAIVCGPVVGIDDWSFAKRKRYGAMIVDLVAHRVVDVLPDRLATTVSKWMKARPGIEMVSRDRGDNFIAGVTEGAPNATQVADRWHLHHNLDEMLKRLVEHHLADLNKLIQAQWHEQTTTAVLRPPQLDAQFYKRETTGEREIRERDERYRQRHATVHDLAGHGKIISEIAQHTGLDRKTVRKILSQPEYSGVPERGSSQSPIDPYRDYIAARLAQGCTNAMQLFKEVAAQGFAGGYVTVWRKVRRIALQSQQHICGLTTAKPSRSSINQPSVFEIIRWLVGKEQALTADQTALLEAWLEVVPAMKLGRDAALRFTEILTKRQPEQLDAWIAEAMASPIKTLRQFAKGIQADHDAVLAALQLPFSNAQLEGQVNRLKVIKRQMYGRANFDLLKIRVMTKV